MLVKRETIEKNPQLVADLVAAHAASTEYLKAHPGQWLKRAAAFGTPLKVLQKAAPNMELAWKMDQGFIKRVANLGGRMKALGIISQEPDYDKLIDLSFVNRVTLKD